MCRRTPRLTLSQTKLFELNFYPVNHYPLDEIAIQC